MLHAILVASLTIAGATGAAPQATRVRAVLPTDDSAWRAGPTGWPDGSRFAVVSGDPAQTGPFMIRVELPSGYRLPFCSHPRETSIVVLAGAIEVDARTLSSGAFMHLHADEPHSLSSRSGAILQIFGSGPLEMVH
jgi:quercetin dioxygenase-like cupin family protein